MSDGIKADPEQLKGMAGELSKGPQGLQELAKSSPPPPQVTSSSDKVGYALSEIMRAAGALIAGMDDTASKIHASNGSYGETDNQNARDIGNVPGLHP